MKLNRNVLAVILSIFLSFVVFPDIVVRPAFGQTQDSTATLQRGYRTGYSDGFMAGYKDIIDGASKEYSRHADYTKADRAYSKDYGSVEDYRDGYQQGFESGYDTGFDKRSFDANMPAGLSKRTVAVNNGGETADTETKPSDTAVAINVPAAIQTNSDASIIIPARDMDLILELQSDLNTQEAREGTAFTAKVSSPSEIAGATIEGRVNKVTKPGRLKGRSEMSLSFDRIVLTDTTRWSNFNAVLTEVMPVKGDNVKRVDTEGTAIGQNSYKQNAIKIGVPTGAGMVVGGLVGGPVGVAVGAGVGAAFGVGAAVVKGGKHIRLNKNQQLRVKTGYETQIR